MLQNVVIVEEVYRGTELENVIDDTGTNALLPPLRSYLCVFV